MRASLDARTRHLPREACDILGQCRATALGRTIGGALGLRRDVLSLTATMRASQLPRDLPAVLWLGLAYAVRRQSAVCSLHPKALAGEQVLLRPGTRDLVTYHDVFVVGYHRTTHHQVNTTTIIDMGANIGLVSMYYATLFPSAEIVAVEMDHDNFTLMQTNLRQFGNRIRAVHAAVWTHSDGVTYSLSMGEDAYTVDASAETGSVERTSPSLTPADLVGMFDGRDVDLVKMDIEGAEKVLLLQSDISWLSAVRCLQVEVHGDSGLLDSLREVIAGAGFTVRNSRVHWAGLEAWRP